MSRPDLDVTRVVLGLRLLRVQGRATAADVLAAAGVAWLEQAQVEAVLAAVAADGHPLAADSGDDGRATC